MQLIKNEEQRWHNAGHARLIRARQLLRQTEDHVRAYISQVLAIRPIRHPDWVHIFLHRKDKDWDFKSAGVMPHLALSAPWLGCKGWHLNETSSPHSEPEAEPVACKLSASTPSHRYNVTNKIRTSSAVVLLLRCGKASFGTPEKGQAGSRQRSHEQWNLKS